MHFGVIIFIIALSVCVYLYASVNSSVEEVLNINDVNSGITLTEDELNNAFVTFDISEIFFMLKDMKERVDDTSYFYIEDEYNPYKYVEQVSFLKKSSAQPTTWAKTTKLNAIMNFLNEVYGKNGEKFLQTYFSKDKTYKIEYEYQYSEIDNLNISNHKIIKIKFIEV